jgi:catechol 2,3-dioxygenase-like lactoylglutathione lyase family enzyme
MAISETSQDSASLPRPECATIEAMKLDRISVIMLGVSDMALSIAFYRDTSGMEVQQQSPGFTFLNGGGVTLALSEPLWNALRKAPGASEVVFGVESVRGAYSELSRRGIQFPREPRNVTGAMWAANFTDPDGHNLSVFGPEGA